MSTTDIVVPFIRPNKRKRTVAIIKRILTLQEQQEALSEEFLLLSASDDAGDLAVYIANAIS